MNKPAFIKRSPLVVGKDYAQLLANLKSHYRKSRIKAAVKVNTSMLEFYWEMGHEISILKATAKWGSAFYDCLSLDLKAEFPGQTGFSVTNIKYAKRWYEFYNQKDIIRHQLGDEFDKDNSEIRQRPVDEFEKVNADEILQRPVEEFQMPTDFGLVPWKHHIEIFTQTKSIEEALFYIDLTIQNGWSRNELSLAIDDGLYKKRGAVITNFDHKLPAPYSGLAKDILKSPYNFEFISDRIQNEHQLEDALANNITRFLLELGSGFAYVGRQMELRMPRGQVFVPDMIFYHTRLKAFIVLEIKVVDYIPEFAGKLNFYVSAVDELMKQEDDNPTIGLLICKSKDDTVVEWSFRGMNQPLGVAEYQLRKDIEKISSMLPSEKEMKNIIDTYNSNGYEDNFDGVEPDDCVRESAGAYGESLKRLHDIHLRLENARKESYDEGMAEGKAEVAKNMKAFGMTDEQIAYATGLPISQIVSLRHLTTED